MDEPPALPVNGEFNFDDDVLSSSSPIKSDYESPVDYTNEVLSAGVLFLLHKPRGSKGLWQAVETGEKLRVAKGKGKKLRLQLNLPNWLPYEDLEQDKIQLQLVECERSTTSPMPEMQSNPYFVIENVTIQGNMLQIEVKLFKISRKLQFVLCLQGKSGQTMQSKTIEFVTHNSGTVPFSKGKDRTNEPLASSSPEDGSTPEHQFDANPKKRKTAAGVPEQQPQPQPPPQQQQQPYYPPQNYPQNQIPQIQTQRNSIELSAIETQSTLASSDAHNAYDPQIQVTPARPTTIVPGTLEVHGTVRAFGFLQFSDVRLKENIHDIADAINIVTQLQGKTYQWKRGTEQFESGGKRVIGLIAQEVQKVLPEVVKEDPSTGFLQVSYAEILPVLIEAFKQLLEDQKNSKQQFTNDLYNLDRKLKMMSIELERNKQERTQEQAVLLKEILTLSETINHQQPHTVVDVQTVQPSTQKKKGKLGRPMLALTFLLGVIMVGIGLGLIFTHLPSSGSSSNSFKSYTPYTSARKWTGYDADMKSRSTDDDSPSSTPADTDAPATPLLFIVGVIISVLGFIAMILGGFGLAMFSFCR